jgi:hypothetical protein
VTLSFERSPTPDMISCIADMIIVEGFGVDTPFGSGLTILHYAIRGRQMEVRGQHTPLPPPNPFGT